MCKGRFYLYIALFLCTLVYGGNAAIAQLRSTNSTFNPKYFKNFTIYLSDKGINMEMDLLRPIQRGFKTHIDYQLQIANAKNFQSVFTREFDVCATITSLKDGVLKNWFKSMMKYGNFKPNCPVEVGHYYLHNWIANSGDHHTFLYPGVYRSTSHFYYGKYQTKSENRILTIVLNLVRNK